jgi:hypothetical protein
VERNDTMKIKRCTIGLISTQWVGRGTDPWAGWALTDQRPRHVAAGLAPGPVGLGAREWGNFGHMSPVVGHGPSPRPDWPGPLGNNQEYHSTHFSGKDRGEISKPVSHQRKEQAYGFGQAIGIRTPNLSWALKGLANTGRCCEAMELDRFEILNTWSGCLRVPARRSPSAFSI